jgi:hypothetical protein
MNVILIVLLLLIFSTAIKFAWMRSNKVIRLSKQGGLDLSMFSTDYVYDDGVQSEWFRARQHGANYELRIEKAENS